MIQKLCETYMLTRGSRKLLEENLEVVLAEFSTLSSAVFVWAELYDMYKHAHIWSWKLGPGFVLLAKVCPRLTQLPFKLGYLLYDTRFKDLVQRPLTEEVLSTLDWGCRIALIKVEKVMQVRISVFDLNHCQIMQIILYITQYP